MNKSILLVVEAVSHEKRIDKSIILSAVEAALAAATKKKHPEDIEARVAVDQETGDYKSYRQWLVTELEEDQTELEFPEREILLEDAKKKKPDIEVGDYIEEEIPSVTFGRIESQMAKQVIIQKVRDAERARVVEEYIDRVGEIVSGIVRKVTRDNIIIELTNSNGVEALLKKEHIIPRESFRVGDRLRAILDDVDSEKTGIQLFASRTSPDFLIELFKIEVPEVEEGLIEFVSAARDPGERAKIAVKSNDSRIDPIGACVGMRGSRVQAVSNELDGERIDIVLWDENAAQFVINAMAPAEVLSIVVDEESTSMDVAVSEENLSQAIGRNGQNIRLASSVTSWALNVMSDEQAADKHAEETQALKDKFVEQLSIDSEVAQVLVQEGFTTVEEVAYVPKQELAAIDSFDEELVEELRNRAKDQLLIKAIASEEELAKVEAPKELMELDGMTENLARILAKNGITTQDLLADQSIDDLTDLDDIDTELAGRVIMAARASWFEEEKESSGSGAAKKKEPEKSENG